LLKTLITSKTRVKLLLKFFLNPQNSAYLRGLSEELEESTNAVRLELNRLESANMLNSTRIGNKKMFSVNKSHPLFKDVNQIVRKYLGIDIIIENIIKGLGEPTKIFLTGDLAEGRNSDLVDIILGIINKNYLTEVVEKTEKLIERKIRYIAYTEMEFSEIRQNKNQLLIWSKD
jgi:hypothetical protein